MFLYDYYYRILHVRAFHLSLNYNPYNSHAVFKLLQGPGFFDQILEDPPDTHGIGIPTKLYVNLCQNFVTLPVAFPFVYFVYPFHLNFLSGFLHTLECISDFLRFVSTPCSFSSRIPFLFLYLFSQLSQAHFSFTFLIISES